MREEIIQERGYSEHIAGSELSLKIASYPATAQYLAERLTGKGRTVCELCCGIGVSLIVLAKQFEHVIGIDKSPDIIRECEVNLINAGVTNYTLSCNDISQPGALKGINADIVLYDIPYWSDHKGRVDPMMENPDLQTIVSTIQSEVTKDIVVYAPPYFTYEQAMDLLGECDFVKVMLNSKHDRNFIFLGNLSNQAGESTVFLTS